MITQSAVGVTETIGIETGETVKYVAQDIGISLSPHHNAILKPFHN